MELSPLNRRMMKSLWYLWKRKKRERMIFILMMMTVRISALGRLSVLLESSNKLQRGKTS